VAEYIVKRFGRDHIGITNELKRWWGIHMGAVLSDSVFSDDGYLITDDEGRYLVSSFLYRIKGCETALMGFPIATPELDNELLDSTDPALIAAGRNALDLLNGKEAPTLGPLKNQLAQQEAKLRAKLTQQFGPGYETTTGGQQALQQFQQQANMTLANAQQQSLGQLLGVVQNTAGQNANIGTQMSLGQLLGSVQNRQIGALQGFGVDPSLGYKGELANSQVYNNWLQQGAKLAGTFVGAAGGNPLAGSGGGSASTAAPSGNTLGASLGVPQLNSGGY